MPSLEGAYGPHDIALGSCCVMAVLCLQGLAFLLGTCPRTSWCTAEGRTSSADLPTLFALRAEGDHVKEVPRMGWVGWQRLIQKVGFRIQV